MHYTILDINSINAFTASYDIGEILFFKVLSGGSENTNYLISTSEEQYVLTICEQKSLSEALHLTQLLEYLAVHDFSTSKIIRNRKNEPVSIYKTKPVILKTFLKGDILKDLSNHLLELIGKQMGKLHHISAPDYLPTQLNYGLEHFEEVADYAPHSDFYFWLQKIKKQIAPYLTKAIPQGLIHSDIFYSNVIISEDKQQVTVMDFEEATHYYRIFDIGMAIVGLCKADEKIQSHKTESLLKGYLQEIELTAMEQEALQSFTVYAAAAMGFWRHKNFNYTNPTPAMKNHYLELKNIADSVNALPVNHFKQRLQSLQKQD